MPADTRMANTDQLPESRAERAQAFKADKEADLGHREIRRAKQVFGAFDPPSREMGPRRFSINGRE